MSDQEPKPQDSLHEDLVSKTRKQGLEDTTPVDQNNIPESNPGRTPPSPITSYEPFSKN